MMSKSMRDPLPFAALVAAVALTFAPARAGDWITDPNAACAVWNPAPTDGEKIVYEGECENGRAHGTGRVKWFVDNKLASIYRGEYRGGRMHGRGVLMFPDGSRYEGEFRSGNRHGRGSRTWPNGDYFVGEYRRGRRHGPGGMDYGDGLRFEGEYRDGKPHGEGGCYTPARGQWACRWENGKLVE